MSFQDTLRDELRREAAAVPLPGREPDAAVSRARRRRSRHRASAAAAAVTVVAVAAAVTVPRVAGDEDGGVDVVNPASTGLSPTGPLDLEWRALDGGLFDMRAAFPDESGVLYALSTGPGVRAGDHPDLDYPQALYRMGEDGTWQPTPLEGDRPDAVDMAGAGGLLYAVSTGPAATPSGDDDGSAARLSTSSDGGDTWSYHEVPMPEAPSDVVDWTGTASVAVESTGSTTIAMVTTMWSPDLEALFPEVDWDDPEQANHVVEQREEGLVLVDYGDVTSATTPPSTVPPAGEGDEPADDPAAPDENPEGSADPEDPEEQVLAAERQAEAEALQSGRVSADGSWGGSAATDVRTIPWSELGVGGLADVGVVNQLLRHTGDGWEPVEPAGLDGFSSFNLGVAGDQFVATGWGQDGRTSTTLVSADGASWAPLEGVTGQVIGVGPALVEIPWESTTIRVSGDAGASWSDVDLSSVAGIDEDSLLMSADGGPMGLALIATGPDGHVRDLVVSGDLMDWTTTPMADVVQSDDEPASVQALVGEDRIVVSATMGPVGEDEPPPTRTAIGTLVRG
jgi:hypothetical protein